MPQSGRAATTIWHGKPNWMVSKGKPPEWLKPVPILSPVEGMAENQKTERRLRKLGGFLLIKRRTLRLAQDKLCETFLNIFLCVFKS